VLRRARDPRREPSRAATRRCGRWPGRTRADRART